MGVDMVTPVVKGMVLGSWVVVISVEVFVGVD